MPPKGAAIKQSSLTALSQYGYPNFRDEAHAAGERCR